MSTYMYLKKRTPLPPFRLSVKACLQYLLVVTYSQPPAQLRNTYWTMCKGIAEAPLTAAAFPYHGKLIHLCPQYSPSINMWAHALGRSLQPRATLRRLLHT
jgi:hypothetical protein